MNAQSELAGDRKRRAEMTRPHSRGVTNWITGVSEKMSTLCKPISASAISALDLPKIELSPAFTEALDRISKTKYDTEVNHRPAWQQCPACTP